MRRLMGVIKDRHGTYYAQQRVPEPLQAAVARVLGGQKFRQVFLKKSLGTKDRKEASVRAKIIQVGFDQVLKRASNLTAPQNVQPKKRQGLNSAEIVRMAEVFFSRLLAEDEERRFGGRASVVRAVEWIRRNDEPDFVLPYPIESVPEFGVTSEQLADSRRQHAEALTFARELLAMGDINAVEDQIALLLDDFHIELDRSSASYRELGTAVLRAYVRACEAISKRDAGEDVSTPHVLLSPNSGTLQEALEGWKKERERPEGTVHEYGRAVAMFVQLHGNIPLLDIKRSHARTFREALQLIPKSRKGSLLKATLPELSEYGRTHPSVQKVSPGTVNKQLGAVQAVTRWGRHNGLVPEDAPWSDPFEEMRLEEEQSQRAPFDTHDLQTIFDAPLFTANKVPEGGKGDAALWLPLLALFAGARQAEYAGLRASDVREDEETGVPLMWFMRDTKAGRRLNTYFAKQKLRGGVHHGYVRIFSNGDDPDFDWNKGGRLYSQHFIGSYQSKSGTRRRMMAINDEPVVEIDIPASYLTIFLSMHGIQLNPIEDPYALAGFGVEHRDAVKSWFTGTFGNSRIIRKWPADMLKEDPELGHNNVDTITEAVLIKYPAMATWGQPLNGRTLSWADLMFMESAVMFGAMRALMHIHDAPSLSVHDSLIVQASKEAIAREAITMSFQGKHGVTPLLKTNPPTPKSQDREPSGSIEGT
jgi:hypothetical protein